MHSMIQFLAAVPMGFGAEFSVRTFAILWSWPTVCVIVILVYRKELSALLARIARASKAKFGGLEFELEVPSASDESNDFPLTEVVGKTYVSTSVVLDGKSFRDCVFENVTLIYRGTGALSLTGNHFNDVSWQFEGAAAQTMNFLAAMHLGMGANGPALANSLIQDWVEFRKGLE